MYIYWIKILYERERGEGERRKLNKNIKIICLKIINKSNEVRLNKNK